MPFTLITAGEKLPEQPLMAQILAQTFGLDRDTAALNARHCRGVLGRDLDEAAAAALESACAALGIRTIRIAAPGIQALPTAMDAKKAVFDNGAAVFSAAGTLVSVAPADVLVLAGGPLRQAVSRTVKTTEGPSAGEKAFRMGIMAVTGLPIGTGKEKEVAKEVKSTELSFCLDVLTAGGARLRVRSDDFDFSGLKEKKTYSSQVNFRLFCGELAAFAPGALKSSGLLAMLEGRPLALVAYENREEIESEEQRLLLIGRR